MAAYLQVTLKHSGIGRTQRQKDTLRGLGLRRLHQVRILKDTAEIRGMIGKVLHLVDWEKATSEKAPKQEKIAAYQLGKVSAKKTGQAKTKATSKKEEKKETKEEAK